MKSLFVIIRTNNGDREILFASEDQFNLDQIFNIREGENQDIVTYRDKITQFFQQYQYFGLIQKNNFLGYTSEFLIDFFAQERKAQCHEILIEDQIFYIQNIKTNNLITLVLVLQKEGQFNSQYANYCLTYIKKSLMKLENESQALTRLADQILTNISLFEKEINSKIPEYEKARYKSIQVRDSVTQIAKQFLNNCELRKNLHMFCQAFINRQPINLVFDKNLRAQLQFTPPQQDMILNPIAITIKPYQTLLAGTFFNKGEQQFSQRFLAFLQKLHPTKSFQEISNLFYFSMNEIQVYVNHLMMNNQNQIALIINKITDDSYFTIACTQTNKSLVEKLKQSLKSFVQFFRTPQKWSQLKQQQLESQQKEGGPGQIFNLIGFRLIRECQVYLYLKNPFLTPKEQDEEINKIVQFQKPGEKSTDREKRFQNLSRLFQSLQKYLGKPYIVQEIAYQKNIDITRFWLQINQLSPLIGFYWL